MSIKACVCYFSLFLKDKCISSFFWTKYIEKKFNLQLLFLPTVSRTFYSLQCYHVLPTSLTSWLEKITVSRQCLWRWHFTREVNRTNHVQTKINIMKSLQTSVIHLIPWSTCHLISNRTRYFFKNIVWSKYFPATTNCRSGHSQEFLLKPVLKIS